MGKVYIHGDVTLVEVAEISPKAVKKNITPRGHVLAEGEQTGHYHAIKDNNVNLFEENGVLYIDAVEDFEIFHQEHSAKPLNVQTGVAEPIKKGKYKVIFPREYDHFAEESRRVAD